MYIDTFLCTQAIERIYIHAYMQACLFKYINMYTHTYYIYLYRQIHVYKYNNV